MNTIILTGFVIINSVVGRVLNDRISVNALSLCRNGTD